MNEGKSTSYLEQPWHTPETLRELAREQQAQLTRLYAQLGTCDYLERINNTPQAWRFYGIVDALIAKGYDFDHVCQWLLDGEARASATP